MIAFILWFKNYYYKIVFWIQNDMSCKYMTTVDLNFGTCNIVDIAFIFKTI